MKILVTGGSGHLGANLLHRLVGTGADVRALYREGSNNAALEGLPVEKVAGDLRDLEAMRRAMKGVQRVYHCAAKLVTVPGEEREIFNCNVHGTRNVLRAAHEASVERIVVTGSFSAVGHRGDGTPSDETMPFYPFDSAMAYEHTKALVELECWRASVSLNLDVRVATSCAILGPHDYKPSRMGEVLISFSKGKIPAYIAPGGFEFVAARDIVEGHLLVMEKGRRGEKYICGSGYQTLEGIMEIMEEVTGAPKPPLKLPASLMGAIAGVTSPILTRFFPRVQQRLTPGAVRILRQQRSADTTKARTELGFQPTPIKDAIREAYEDFVRRGLIVARPGREPAALRAKEAA